MDKNKKNPQKLTLQQFSLNGIMREKPCGIFYGKSIQDIKRYKSYRRYLNYF